MKCLIAIVILAILGSGQDSAQPQKAKQLLDRFDALLNFRESGWRVSDHTSVAASDSCWRHWENNGTRLDISVMALASPEEAAETLKSVCS